MFSKESISDIESAHCFQGIPPSEIIIPYPSIRSLLDSQTRRYGEKPFLIHYDEKNHRSEYSFRDVFQMVSKTANFLESESCTFGDRVAIDTSNRVETIIHYFSVWMIGGTAVVIDKNQSTKVIEKIIRETKVKLFFTQPEISQEHRDLRQKLFGFTNVIETTPDFITSFLENQSETYKIGMKSKLRDDGLIFYKSPKNSSSIGVILSHYNLMVNGMGIADWNRLSDEQPVVCGVNLVDIEGITGCLMMSLYSGAPIIILEQHYPSSIVNAISNERAQVAIVNPKTLKQLTDQTFPKKDFPTFRHFLCTQPISPELIETVKKKLNVPVISGYSIPETTSFSTFLPLDFSIEDYHKMKVNKNYLPIGYPSHPNELDIQNNKSKSLSEGEKGEIVIRGHNVMKGYFKNKKATEDVFKHGWLHTGKRGLYLKDKSCKRFYFQKL